VANAIVAADAGELLAGIKLDGKYELSVNSEKVEVELADLIVTETPTAGWSVASAQGISVALDLNLSADLISEGLAREVVRFIQDSRKSAGFEVTDRILIKYETSSELDEAIQSNLQWIASEVLATEIQAQLADSVSPTAIEAELGLKIWLVKA